MYWVMTENELGRLAGPNEKIDPLLMLQIVEPMLFVLQRRQQNDNAQNGSENWTDGRAFAELLLHCANHDEAESLCERFPEGCSQLGFFLDKSLLRVLLRLQEMGEKVQPIDGKPYSALARLALDWIDAADPEPNTRRNGGG